MSTVALDRRDAAARLRRRLGRTLSYVAMITACVVVLLPLVAVLIASLKTSDELNSTNPLTPPRNLLNVDNYVFAFEHGDMAAAFGRTLFILVVSVAGTVVIGTMTAYVVSRFDFRMKRGILFLFLLAAVIPPVTTNVATFQIISGLGLYNSRWALIVLFLGTDIISIYIFLQFLRTIPRDLDEAALLDGASYFRIYRSVIIPLMKPAIATVVIIKSVAIYNEFYLPFLYTPDSDQFTVSMSMFTFKGPYGTHWEQISAGAIILIIPTLILFLALQRYVYNGFASGATK